MKLRRVVGIGLLALSSVWFIPTARALTVVHTNDVMGELEPCGCRTNPLGGMARMANLLKRTDDKNLLLLDAGDLLFSTDEIPEALKKQSLLQAKDLLKALDLVHEDAVVPGEKDFAMGTAAFKKLISQSKIKFIAANLKAKGGKSLLPPNAVFKRKGDDGKEVKIAVIGLVGEDLKWPKDLKATSPIAAAKAQIKALRAKADYVIALTHEGLEADEALAKAVPGIDFIIGAHSQSFLQTPGVVKHEGSKAPTTYLLQSSFRNQYVGMLPLKQPFQIENYKLVGLDAGYDSPAQAPSAMDDLVKKFKSDVAELNSHEEAEMTAEASKSSGSTSVKYQTFPRCAECHLKQFDFWRKTPHARAFDTLVKANQSQNKECLSCHSVGMGDPKGYEFVTRLAETHLGDDVTVMPLDDLHAYLKAMVDADSINTPVKVLPTTPAVPLRQSLNALNRSFTPVQCENCHQPGRDHPFFSGYTKTVDTAQTCLKCHSPERAPEWYKGNQPDWKVIEAKRAKMTCPAGDLPAE